MATYPAIESVTKPSLALESVFSVAIYRRLGRAVYRLDNGDRWSFNTRHREVLNQVARECAAAGYKLAPRYGCEERWIRQ